MNTLRQWLAKRVGLKSAIAAFCLALVGAIWTAVVLQTQSERAATIAEAIRQNSNLARVFEEHAIRTIKGVDAAALFVAGEYARLGSKIDLAGYAADGRIDAALFADVFVIDERGDLLAGLHSFAPTSLADRAHFTVHLPRDSGKLFINKPLLGRVSGKWTIHMSRRITRPDGSFGGVVSMAVDPSYFTDFYRQTDLGKLGLVNLVGLDGVSRARLAGQVASFGQDMSKSDLLREQAKSANGDFLSTGRIEGVPRYESFRTIPGYPLLVSVGASQEEVLAGYLEERRNDFWAALLFTAVIAAFGVLLIAALERQKRAVAALAGSEAQFRAIFNQAAIGISQTALDGRILQANQKLCEMLGYSAQELPGRSFDEISHPDDVARSAARRQRLLAGETTDAGIEKRYLRKDGSVVWVAISTALVRNARGEPDYFVSMIEGIGERRQLQQDLLHLAHHDNLTGLPNRALFYDRLEHALGQARRRKWITGVMFVDLDQFKAVNDTLGHGAGDQLLRQVSARLTHCVRADDTIGRLGGDEFAVILSELRHDEDAGLVARKIIDAVAAPFQIDGERILVTASIGIACCPPDSTDADTLVRNADTAMYEAKQMGKNNYRFHTAATNERAQARLALETERRKVLTRSA
jgi:diguanylate cyclase (GGDEF)-like protein/PAS domain S-box-containing protein